MRPSALGLLIEGESLLNDGTSIVVFGVLITLVTGGGELSLAHGLVEFVWVVAGGAFVGFVIASVAIFALSRSFNEPLIEITLTIVVAYASMLIAEGVLHVSGVIALVVAGLWMGDAVARR